MTTLLDQVPTGEITALGRQTRPARPARLSRILETTLLGIFIAIGWLTGRACLAVRDCIISIRVGWHVGRHSLTMKEAVAQVHGPEPS